MTPTNIHTMSHLNRTEHKKDCKHIVSQLQGRGSKNSLNGITHQHTDIVITGPTQIISFIAILFHLDSFQPAIELGVKY